MTPQHPHTREHHTCVLCGGAKDKGLLLCWPCHHKQKSRNDGDYGKRAYQAIASCEARLSSQNQEVTP